MVSIFFEEVELGQPLPARSIQFSHEQVLALVTLWTPSRGPTHFDSQQEAEKNGFERPIIPDHLSIAYLGNVVLGWADNVGLLQLDTISRRVMFDSDEVMCTGTVVDKGLYKGQTAVHADLQILSIARDECAVTASALISVPVRQKPAGTELQGAALSDLASEGETLGTGSGDLQGLGIEFDRSLIGVERDRGEVVVTAEMIVEYARAVGATNPIFWDAGAAQHGRYGGLVALPTFCSILGRRDDGRGGPEVDLRFGSRGQQATLAVRSYKPIRPGDVLRLSSTLKSVYAKTGRSGVLVFAVFEDSLYDSQGDRVAEIRHSSVRY